jgi:hypothetical protein
MKRAVTNSGRRSWRRAPWPPRSSTGRVTEAVIGQLEGEGTGEVFDRGDLFEDLFEAALEEPRERVVLNGEKVGEGQDFGIFANEKRSATREDKGSLLGVRTTRAARYQCEQELANECTGQPAPCGRYRFSSATGAHFCCPSDQGRGPRSTSGASYEKSGNPVNGSRDPDAPGRSRNDIAGWSGRGRRLPNPKLS